MTTQETLVLIKPDGVARNLTGEILRRIEAKGYQLVDVRLVQADVDLLAAHYEEHQGKPFYEPLVEFMLHKRVAVRVDVTRTRSWDHRKLGMDPIPLGGTTAEFL